MEGKGISICYKQCRVDITADPHKLRELLQNIVELINMKPLGEAQVEKVSSHLPGCSAIQMIETSHIAVHGFSDSVSYMFSLESCKDFSEHQLMKYLSEYFQPTEQTINSIYSLSL